MRLSLARLLNQDVGSTLPLGVGILCFGVALLLSAVHLSELAIEKERALVLADSLAWRYSSAHLAAASPSLNFTETITAAQHRFRANVRLLQDNKTVHVEVCNPDGVCATSLARSTAQVPQP